jgi:ABC-type branched-subunit amino acid transport system substrate-binding protein
VFTRTGPFSAFAAGSYEAADAFFKNLNAQGGVDGYTFKFVGLDSQGDPAIAATNYKRLIEQEHADAIMVLDDASFAGAYTPIKGSGVPAIGCVGSLPCFHTPGMYPITAYTPAAFAAVTADYLVSKGENKSNVLAIDIPNAKAGASVVQSTYTQQGIQIPFSTTFAVTTADFTALVARAKATGAGHTVFLGNSATQLVPLVQSAVQQDYKTQVLATGYGVDWPKQLGGSAADGLVVTAPTGPVYGAGQAGADAAAVVHKYYPSIDLQSSVGGVESWITGEAIVAAVKGLHGAPVTPSGLMQALNGFKDWQGTFNVPLTYADGPNPEPAHCLQLLEIKNGGWTPLDGQRFHCTTKSIPAPSS